MEILTDKQIAQLYDKIVQNPRFIPTLSEQQSIELTHHAEKIMSYWDKIFKAVAESDDSNPVMQEARYLKYTTESPNYQTAKALLLALDKNPPQPDDKVSMDPPVKNKKRGIDPFPRHYAYFHYSYMLYVDRNKEIPKTIKETVKYAEGLYPGINGRQFYNKYREIKSKSKSIVNSIKNMKPKDREILRGIVCKFGTEEYILWWNKTFPEKI